MGYYTTFELEVTPENSEIGHKQMISDATGYTYCFDDDIKWYSHQEDMKIYSEKHPTVLFKLTGIGEEPDDIWVEYYKNGKMQRCKGEIVYPPFDPTKLK